MEDPKDIKELIKQVIKVDNRIYQSKKAKKKSQVDYYKCINHKHQDKHNDYSIKQN